jgi:hypothetical protein
MAPTTLFRERRSTPRSGEICLRRRHNPVRATPFRERRRRKSSPFDIAAALELNLDRFPTKSGMLTLLQSWRYAAEASGPASNQPYYARALNRAVEIMREARDPPHAIVQLWRKENIELLAA